jgi:hypothetical protein
MNFRISSKASTILKSRNLKINIELNLLCRKKILTELLMQKKFVKIKFNFDKSQKESV